MSDREREKQSRAAEAKSAEPREHGHGGEGGDWEFVERLDPAHRADFLSAQHWARYEWAAMHLPEGARVLDCACGVGYGSALLRARGAREVLGVDNAEEAVEAARRRYAPEGVTYRLADAFELDVSEVGRFDAIVCLETLEHVDRPRDLLDLFKGLLSEGGRLMVSVPNDHALGVDNPFHRWKARFEEVRSWLEERFAHVVPALESHSASAAVWPESGVRGEGSGEPEAGRMRRMDGLDPSEAPGFLFACSDAPIEGAAPLSVDLLTGLATAHQEIDRLASANAELREWIGAETRAKAWQTERANKAEAEVERLRAWSEELEQAREWLEEQAEQQKAIAAERKTWTDQLERDKAWLEEQAAERDKDLDRLRGWVKDRQKATEWLEKQLEEQQKEAAKLREWAQEQETGRAWFQGQLELQKNEIEGLQKEVEELRDWNLEQEKGRAWLEEQVENHRVETERLRAWISDLEGEKTRLAHDLATMERSRDTEATRAQRLEAERNGLLDRLRSLRAALLDCGARRFGHRRRIRELADAADPGGPAPGEALADQRRAATPARAARPARPAGTPETKQQDQTTERDDR